MGSLELERRARPVPASSVDKSVDNVDNWEFGEFGEFNERTYRYDYHASLLGGISLGKPF